jgi:hypothetical protein
MAKNRKFDKILDDLGTFWSLFHNISGHPVCYLGQTDQRFQGPRATIRQWKSGLPDFSWHNIPKREKHTKCPQTIPKDRKIYEMAKNRMNGHNIINIFHCKTLLKSVFLV